MREILFRGKTKKGNWAEGWFCGATCDSPHGDAYQSSQLIEKNTLLWLDVIPETVGQYTGLTDKYGKKIFEGDIVRYSYDYPYSPFLKAEGKTNEDIIYRTGDVFWSEWRGAWAVGTRVGKHAMNQDLYVYIRNPNRVEIIGNIHDNPELLKGE